MQQLGKNRSHLQIFAEILELCKELHAKTRILNKAYLSYQSLQQNLTQLQAYRLLEKHHSKEAYFTTGKGLKFLQRWASLQQLLEEEPLELILYSRKNKIQFICETNSARGTA